MKLGREKEGRRKSEGEKGQRRREGGKQIKIKEIERKR